MPFFFISGFGAEKGVQARRKNLRKELALLGVDLDKYSVTMRDLPQEIKKILL